MGLLSDGRYAIHKVDFEKGVALRMLLDTLLFEEQLENKVMVATLSAKDREISTLKKERDKLYITNEMLATNYHASQENLMNCGTKLASKKAWAAVGITGTIIVGVAVLTAGTVAILNSIP